MKTTLTLLAGLCLATPALAGGMFEDGAVATAAAAQYCEDVEVSDYQLGVAIALAASEMHRPVSVAQSIITYRAIASGNQMQMTGAIDAFCRDMAKVIKAATKEN